MSHYRVYYGHAPGAYEQPLGTGLEVRSATSFTVPALDRGRTYYFAVTAVDMRGNESDYSNEAVKPIP